MNVKIDNIKLEYIKEGRGRDLVLLHGWGQNKEMMLPLLNNLKEDFCCYSFDLPGFGKSTEPDKAFSVYDYAVFLHKAFNKLGIEKPIIVGHSFGGKIALVMGAKYEVESLVLLASPAFAAKTSIKTKILKAFKKLPFMETIAEKAKKFIGSTDYKNASGVMREILISTVNTDITEDLKEINVPCIFIFGTRDEAVSLNDAYKMSNLVKDGALIKLPEGTHYAYLEFLGQVVAIIKSIGENK